MQRLLSAFDPMVRLLLVAILLASLFPATGDARAVAQAVSSGAIFLLFFLNGVRLSRTDVLRGLGNLRVLVVLALWCFGLMALAGLGLMHVGHALLPPLVALGFLYLGVLPSTVQSATAYSSLAGGEVALSVVAAALLNILGVFVAAPLFALLGGGHAVDLGWDGLARVAAILLLPFALGQGLQPVCRPFVAQHPALIRWADRMSIAIAVYVAFSGAVEQGLWQQLGGTSWLVLLVMEAALLAFAFGGAWLVGAWLGLDRGERISFLFAGAHKVSRWAPRSRWSCSPRTMPG